ncbi:MAG: hypothetical protein V3U87_13740 [Methylococcaceae bacterium]
MKASPLMKGIVFALLSSGISCILYFALSPFFINNFLIKLLISVLGFSYIVYLFSQSQESIGRVTVISLWSLLMISAGYFSLSVTLIILIQIIAIWLIRSLYFHSSFISSLADLALNGLSLAIAFWAFSQTESLFLTLWCFFLTQALFVLIPTNINESSSNETLALNNKNDFQQAYRAAEAAVKQLTTHS